MKEQTIKKLKHTKGKWKRDSTFTIYDEKNIGICYCIVTDFSKNIK
jgi:hypothetical protein